MSEYGINDRHNQGEDVSRLPSNVSPGNGQEPNNRRGSSIPSWVWIVGILLLVNLVSYIFNLGFWLY